MRNDPPSSEKRKQWAERVDSIDPLTLEEFTRSRGPRDPKVCKIYVLLNNNEIGYVGQSRDIRSRLKHRYSPFDSVRFLEVPKDDLRMVEDLFIKKYQPKRNRAGLPASVRWERDKQAQQVVDREEVAAWLSNGEAITL